MVRRGRLTPAPYTRPVPDTSQHVYAALEHWRAGRRDQARTLLKRTLQRDPAHPGANQLYAVILSEDGQFDQALFFIDRAIKGDPSFADFRFTLGLIRTNTPDQQGALDAFLAATQLDPNHAEAWQHAGTLLADRGRIEQAESALRRALALNPALDAAAAGLARVLNESARAEEAAALLSGYTAPGRDPSSVARSTLAFTLNYIDADPAQALAAHTAFGRDLPRTPPPRPAPGDAARRPRVVLISPDLRDHAVSRFVEPILRHHDRSAIELFAYHLGGKVDAVSDRLRPLAGLWRHVYPPTDPNLLAAIRADRPDILVELAGHTSVRLLEQLAPRLAPVQVTYIGYPNTTGVPSIDARLVDATTDPPGAERWATERLVRLPGCFLCYQPPENAPQPRPPAEPVFGSFNNPAKLSTRTIELWSAVLAAVPGSRLLLKGKALDEPSVRGRLQARFPDPSRVECRGEVPDAAAHLDLYSRVAVALDPVPYNGTTTTCEALWMGVPVVTLEGATHASRVGSSLLAAAGHPELIARTPDEYIRIASSLISDPDRTAHYRATLRSTMAGSRLCDGPAHARAFEAAMRELWGNWCAGRRP